MQLETKDDFPQVLERFEAWWQCEIIDRPLVTINVRRDRAALMPQKQHASQRDRWMDVEYALDRMEASLDGAVFLGESFPQFFPDIGPEVAATVFGCELEFSETTSWSNPVAGSCREILNIQPNLDNEYWNTIRRMTDASLRRGRGKWITGLTDLHTNGDLLASLRDPQELCLDLADDIDSVRAACEHMTDCFQTMFDDLWNRIAAAGQPCTTWLPSLHAGRAYATSCDFICMISPEMFRRTILPSLVREMRFLERNIFHLDGPGALRHLDDLLELPEMDGLQWVYGAGNGPARKWTDVYRKAQAAGKCQQILCEDVADAKAVAEHIRPEGAWFAVHGSYSLAEADDFIRWVESWAAGKE